MPRRNLFKAQYDHGKKRAFLEIDEDGIRENLIETVIELVQISPEFKVALKENLRKMTFDDIESFQRSFTRNRKIISKVLSFPTIFNDYQILFNEQYLSWSIKTFFARKVGENILGSLVESMQLTDLFQL